MIFCRRIKKEEMKQIMSKIQRKWQKIHFLNSRNNKLAALFYTQNIANTPTLIVCHGFTGSKEGAEKALEMAEYFVQGNIDVLLFDFAGLGESEGNFVDLTLTNQIDDPYSAINWCEKQGSNFIITMGRSFGGTTAICHAAQDNRVKAVCTWAAPASLDNIFGPKIKRDDKDPTFVNIVNESGSIQIKQDFYNDITRYDVGECAAEIAPRPLCIIHGLKDEVVQVEEAQKIYNAAADPKELHYIENGDHMFRTTHSQVWQISFNWIKNVIYEQNKSQ